MLAFFLKGPYHETLEERLLMDTAEVYPVYLQQDYFFLFRFLKLYFPHLGKQYTVRKGALK